MIEINSEADMLKFGSDFAKKLIADKNSPRVLELTGDVGTGKTTFVRGLAKGLGVQETVTSPSFTISKSYALSDGGNLVHYDFYRLTDPGLMAEDLDEAIKTAKNLVVVEWAESVKDLLPEERIILRLSYKENGSRKIEVEK